jgi:hypothetical protein
MSTERQGIISMSTVSLFAWMATVLVGLILLVIWLMEYDSDFQSIAATRLPVPVISSHALLGMGGLAVWGFYLVTDEDRLVEFTLADLAIVATLGLIMAVRWIHVYRTYADPGSSSNAVVVVPPERHFPRPVIVIHGILAVTTIVLVLFSVFSGGS